MRTDAFKSDIRVRVTEKVRQRSIQGKVRATGAYVSQPVHCSLSRGILADTSAPPALFHTRQTRAFELRERDLFARFVSERTRFAYRNTLKSPGFVVSVSVFNVHNRCSIQK